MDEDAVLLERWRDGDSASGRALFARYFDALYRFFETKCDEPDDLVQSTFLALTRSQRAFTGRGSFRAYVYAIARNELYMRYRALRREREFDPDVSSIAEIVTTPAGRLARNQQHRQLLEALRTLPVEQQTLLELHYWEELDPAALAEVFDVTPGVIRTRLYRARTALRAALAHTRYVANQARVSAQAARAADST